MFFFVKKRKTFPYHPMNYISAIVTMPRFFHRSSGGPREEQRRRTEVNIHFLFILKQISLISDPPNVHEGRQEW